MTPTPENVEAARPIGCTFLDDPQPESFWLSWTMAGYKDGSDKLRVLRETVFAGHAMKVRLNNGQTVIIRAKGGVK